jgi:sugar phosphate isomerase/epimerase
MLAWQMARERKSEAPFRSAFDFLKHCHELGAGGVQAAIEPPAPSAPEPRQLRAAAEAWGMFLEGQASLPQDSTAAEIDRFGAELARARDAGATVVRAAMLSGRRYETFDSAAAFRQFSARSWASLQLAEPVVRKHRLKLAIENHKDWLAGELLEMLKRLGSEHIGVCVDTGNNIALLEEPMTVVRALAPVALSVHLKDMAVRECEDGFLLSETPLGEGFLDLAAIVACLETANPGIQFCLEMITRNPLKIPCLTDRYWQTMQSAPAQRLASALAFVRRTASSRPLPSVEGLSRGQHLALEEENVKKSLACAAQKLGL